MKAHQMIDRAHEIMRKVRMASDGSVRSAEVGVIVMSRDTFREIIRDRDSASYTNYPHARDKATPDTIFGVRIAYDDSMALGEMFGAEMLK